MKKTAIAIFLASFVYYTLLAAKGYTWLYASQDSGDWLTASSIWIVPQPMGSPLYVFLGHFLNLFPGSLEIKMTILMSSLPSAVTVSLVYLVCHRLLGPTSTSLQRLVPPLILLGAAIFLSQSTILEEYALTTMLIVLAYYLYIRNSKRLTLLALGLATATHIMGLVFFLMWSWADWPNRKEWIKHTWIYIAVGLLPYAYVPILMALHTPPFMTGYWSWAALKGYLFGTSNAIVFRISVFDFPERAVLTIVLLIMCLGLAIIPATIASTWSQDNKKKILLMSAIFPIVYYLLCLDPSTWTFLTFGLPFLTILAAIGLSKIHVRYQPAVVIVAVLMIVANPFFYNPDTIQAANDPAQDIKTQLETLPANSVVVSYPGAYSMATYYINSTSRHDIIPIVWQETGMGDMIWEYDDLRIQYKDYCQWLFDNYNIPKGIPIDQISWCIDNGYEVYIGAPEWAFEEGAGDVSWTHALESWLTIEGTGRLRQITKVCPCWIP